MFLKTRLKNGKNRGGATSSPSTKVSMVAKEIPAFHNKNKKIIFGKR